MRDNPTTTPNGEPSPDGGGRVAPSRTARHARQHPGEYPYHQQGQQPRPNPYADPAAPTQAWTTPGARPPSPDGYGYGNGNGNGAAANGHTPNGYAPNGQTPNGHTPNGYAANGGRSSGGRPSGTYPTGSYPPGGYQDPRQPPRPGGYAQPGASGQPGPHARGGRTSGGRARTGYATPDGYARNGYPPSRGAPGVAAPTGQAPDGYTANGYAPGGYAPDGYAPGGRSSNGYAPGRQQRVVPSRAARHAPGRARSGYPPSGSPQGVAPSRAARYSRPPATGRQARHARRKQRSFWTELPVLIIAAFVLAIGVKGYVVQAFYIPSGSMIPTLQINDRVLVNRLAYQSETVPEHGDVIVFVREIPGAPPPDDGPFSAVQRAVAQGLGNAPPGSEDLIKRVMGRPGDVVEGREGRVWRNGQPLEEPYLASGTVTEEFGPVTVPPGHLWVMGDNRGDSADSRVFGPVPMTDLVGRAVVLVWPFDHVGGL